jgi:acyl-CoA synthetase (NDP forming)
MINQSILNPASIVVVGGSNNLRKPGGRILLNIVSGGFTGKLFVVNPKDNVVQGFHSYADVNS